MKNRSLCLIGCLIFLLTSSGFAFDKGDYEDLTKSKKCGGTFSSCDLNAVRLIDLDLSNAEMEGADLRNAYIENTNLSGANLDGANLTGATLKYVNLAGAIVSDAKFNNAKLHFVDLSVADLSDSVLKGAAFVGVYLKRSKCIDVDFSQIDTSLIDFSGATGILNGPCANDSFGACRK